MKRFLKNLIVIKPWGNEYVICSNKSSSVTLLNIKHKHKTSLHCHPSKKTGFIVLEGKVEVKLGFYDKILLKGPSKLMIRPGLFHSTKAVSKKGATVLEIESPVDKDDLVRFQDDYGREDSPYESRKKMKKITKNEIIFQIPKKQGINKYKYNNLNITLERHLDTKNFINRPIKTIFAIIDGGLVDSKKRFVLSPGDIVRTDTIIKLSQVFKVNKKISFMTVSNNK